MNRQRHMSLGMLGLGIGYFACFTPYSGLARALANGLLPGSHGPVSGPVLLPASALGMLCAMPVFMIGSGWFRHSRSRQFGRFRLPLPGRETALSAAFMTLIVSTTTLNFTFPGFAIVFILVLERMETIVLAPTIDLLHGRKIYPSSWAALALCLLAVVAAFADVHAYRLSAVAFASVGVYLLGYAGRFQIMSRYAKKGTRDMRYFAEEHMTTPVLLVFMLGILALIGQGPALHALREGFTSFLLTPSALAAFGVGVCYEGLFIFTTLIFLDPREFAFCMPVHVCASLLAGIVASFGLHAIFGTANPSAAQLVAAVCVITAAFVLSYPAFMARWVAIRRRWAPRLLLFVCGSNTSRSAMASSIARAELISVLGRAEAKRWRVASAGVSASVTGAPMPRPAVEALRELSVPVLPHRSRKLTRRMCQDSTAVYCMTQEHRNAVVAFAPELEDRVYCLDPDDDVATPAGTSMVEYVRCARQLRVLVGARVLEQIDRTRTQTYPLSTAADGST